MQSRVSTAFWAELGEHKLHRLKLAEGPVPMVAHYAPSNDPHNPGFLSLEEGGLDAAASAWTAEGGSSGGGGGGGAGGRVPVGGDLYCLNTREQLAKFDRKAAAAKVRSPVVGCYCP